MSWGFVLLICSIGGESGRPDFDERWVLACLRYMWCFEAAWKNALEARLVRLLRIGVFEHLKPEKNISNPPPRQSHRIFKHVSSRVNHFIGYTDRHKIRGSALQHGYPYITHEDAQGAGQRAICADR